MSYNVGLSKFRTIMRDLVALVQESPPGQQQESLVAKIYELNAQGEEFYGGGVMVSDSPMSSRMS